MKLLKGKRTMVFNGLVMTFGVIETADFSFLPPETSGPLLIGIGIAGVWLRILTTGPVGKDK